MRTNYNTPEFDTAMFDDLRSLHDALKFETWDSWATEETDYAKLPGEPAFSFVSEGGGMFITMGAGFAVHAKFYGGEINVWILGTTNDQIDGLMEEIKAAFPVTVAEEGHIAVEFSARTPHGNMKIFRTVAAPSWDEIHSNYSAGVEAQLAELMDPHFDQEHSGKLILWTGEAGTGKTFALRAMCRAWKDWCDVQYIVDPDQLFGDYADYLLETVVQGEADKWKLIVLEDTGELISADAKERMGQGLARLLNVCDGLIGQGLKILVLITTNEEVGKLHDAVLRPGRRLADIHFNKLSGSEVVEWLRRHEVEDTVPDRGSFTIAQLYELKEFGTLSMTNRLKSVGF